MKKFTLFLIFFSGFQSQIYAIYLFDAYRYFIDVQK